MSDRPSEPRRILVVRLSAIGDVTHGLPLARTLRRLHPRARITWAVQEEPAPLLMGHPWVDCVEIFPRRDGPIAIAKFLARLGQGGFDIAIDVQGNLKSALVTAASRAPARLGLARRDCREPLSSTVVNARAAAALGPHSLDRTLALCRHLGDPAPSAEYGLSPTQDELRRAREDLAGLPDPLLAVSVGSLEDVREWTDDAYVETVRRLIARDVSAVVLSGPRDAPRGRRIAEDSGAACRAGDTDLRGLLAHLAALAERRAALLACDSAPVHLAVAVGLPTVVLSGPQDPRRTGPYGFPESALTRWEELPCAPCLKRTCRLTEDHRACMRRIGPADVVRRALASVSDLS